MTLGLGDTHHLGDTSEYCKSEDWVRPGWAFDLTSPRRNANLRERRSVSAFKRRALNHHCHIARLVGEGSCLGAVVQCIAELLEHAPRRAVLRHNRRVDPVKSEFSEGEGVGHEREPRSEAFPLMTARADHERELSCPVADAAQVGIADQFVPAVQKERARTFVDHRLVMSDDVRIRKWSGMAHESSVVRLVVPGRELDGMGRDLLGPRLDRDQFPDISRPLDTGPGSGRHAGQA